MTPPPRKDLLGAAEAAKLLGWDRRKLSTYHSRGVLPAPVTDLAATPVWRRADILRYSIAHKLGLLWDTILKAEGAAWLKQTYGLSTDSPLGAQLAVLGTLTEEEGLYFDSQMEGSQVPETQVHEARTPADAYERWVGGQSVTEFVGNDTPEAAVDEYIRQITEYPAGGPVEQYGCEPTERERRLLIDYVTANQPVPPGDLVGHAEAAALLGWDNRKLGTYRTRGLVPTPLRELASGPVWQREDIVRYSIERKLGLLDLSVLKPDSPIPPGRTRENLRTTYGLNTDSPLGAQLAVLGTLTEEEGEYLDTVLRGGVE